MKKLTMLILVLILSLGLVACTTGTDTPDVDDPVVDEDLEVFTREELAEFDGQDGNPAYIAVDGIVYDVTDSNLWQNGEHNGFEAGRELTQELGESAPHDESVLERLPVVGALQD